MCGGRLSVCGSIDLLSCMTEDLTISSQPAGKDVIIALEKLYLVVSPLAHHLLSFLGQEPCTCIQTETVYVVLSTSTIYSCRLAQYYSRQ